MQRDDDPARSVAIDRLKGIAIVAVVCIHAGVLEGTPFYEYGLNRAVPIFLVLFGMTATLSRERAAGGVARWYRARFTRIWPPVVVAGAAYVLLAAAFGRLPPSYRGLTLVAAVLGYSPWVGTSWFVTLVLQLVLAFPLLHALGKKLPAWFALPLAAVISSECILHVWEIAAFGTRFLGDDVPEPGFQYAWVFPPRVLYDVMAGVLLIRIPETRRRAWVIPCIALLALEPLVVAFVGESPEAIYTGPLRRQVVIQLFDAPLAVALLGTVALLPAQSLASRFLEMSGRASWGIYLGHTFLHEAFHLWGRVPEAGDPLRRLWYAVVLFTGGFSAAGLGAAILLLLREAANHRRARMASMTGR